MLLLLGLATVACYARKRSRAGRVLGLLALAYLFAAGCGPLPRLLLARLQAGYAPVPAAPWGQRNAIVMLGAGNAKPGEGKPVEPSLYAYARLARAVALYRDCKQGGATCKLLITGGDAQHYGTAEATAYGAFAPRLGVDPGDLILEPKSMNTWQNAQFSSALLRDYGPDRVLLVSAATHLRRGLLYFAHFGVHGAPVRADYISVDAGWLPSAYNLALTDLAIHEYLGIARYAVYNLLGLNVAPTKAGAL